MATKNLLVRAGADFSSITTQANKASASMKSMSTSVSGSCSKMQSAVSLLKKAFNFAAIAATLRTVYNTAKDCTDAYEAQAEAETKLASVMRNTMGASTEEINSVKELCSAQQELGIVGDEVQEAGAAQLAKYLDTTDALETLIPVMNDMTAASQGYEATADGAVSAATILGKAMEGNTTSLERQGYVLTAAQEKMLTYGTEEQRAATLADVVSSSVGGMNKALAKTPTGRMQQLSNTLGDIKENFGKAFARIGTVLLPVLNKVAAILADVATLANKVAQAIANVFGGGSDETTSYTYSGVSDSASDLSDSYDDVSDSASDAGQSVTDLNNALKKSDIDILHTLGSSSSSSSGSSGSGDTGSTGSTGDTGSGIKAVTEESEEAGESIGWLEDKLKSLKEWLSNIGLQEMIDKAKEALEKIKPVLEYIWENILKPIGEFIVETLIDALTDLFDLIGDIGDLLTGKISFTEFISQLDGLQVALLAIGGVAVISGIENVITKLGTLGTALFGGKTAADTVTTALAGTSTTMSELGSMATLFATNTKTSSAVSSAAVVTMALAWDQTKTSEENYQVGLEAGNMTSQESAEYCQQLAARVQELQAEWDNLTPLQKFLKGHDDLTAAQNDLNTATEQYVKNCKEEGVAVDENIAGLSDVYSTSKSVSDFFTGIFNPAMKSTTHTTEDLAEAHGGLSGSFDKVGDSGKSAGDKIKSAMDGVKSSLSDAKTKAQDFASGIKEKFEGLPTWFSTNVSTPLKNTLGTMWEGAKQKASDAWNGVKNSWSGVSSWASGIGNAIANGISNAFQGLISKAQSAANTIRSALSGITSVISSINSSISSAISNAQSRVNALVSGVSTTLTTLTSKASSVVSTVKSTISSASLPHLAAGAVIPPNTEFAAILGDQTKGYNIETPEELLRSIFREESGNGNAETVDLMRDILSAVKAGKVISVDGRELGRTTNRSLAQLTRAYG